MDTSQDSFAVTKTIAAATGRELIGSGVVDAQVPAIVWAAVVNAQRHKAYQRQE